MIKKVKPDLIISTHPFSNQMCGRLKRHGKINCKIATVMTDFHTHSQWLEESDYINYYFVANSSMKEDLMKIGIDEFKIFVTGIPLSRRFSEAFNKEEILNELQLESDKFTILFFAGRRIRLRKNKNF